MGKLSKRAAMCGNAAASCERENSRIERYKSKLSSSMRIKIMTARSRVARNEPPLYLFDAGESVKYWIFKNHRDALKLRFLKGSKMIERKKKEKEKTLPQKSFQRNTLKFEFYIGIYNIKLLLENLGKNFFSPWGKNRFSTIGLAHKILKSATSSA